MVGFGEKWGARPPCHNTRPPSLVVVPVHAVGLEAPVGNEDSGVVHLEADEDAAHPLANTASSKALAPTANDVSPHDPAERFAMTGCATCPR
jgi:hypothetical protein